MSIASRILGRDQGWPLPSASSAFLAAPCPGGAYGTPLTLGGDPSDEGRTLDFEGFAKVESYQYVGEDSKVHLDMRVAHSQGFYRRKLTAMGVVLIALIGVVLGLISTAMIAVVSLLHEAPQPTGSTC